jgi:hypothetical protein
VRPLGWLSAFLSVVQDRSEDRSAAAFLVTSVIESWRHPEPSNDEHGSLKDFRGFISWVVNDAITQGELNNGTDVNDLVEILMALMCGIGD